MDVNQSSAVVNRWLNCGFCSGQNCLPRLVNVISMNIIASFSNKPNLQQNLLYFNADNSFPYSLPFSGKPDMHKINLTKKKNGKNLYC